VLGDVLASSDVRELRVTDIGLVARDIKLIRLEACDGQPLPPAEPGAHLTLILPNGLERQFSLIEPGAMPSSYLLGVKLEPESRGGSRYLFDDVRVGDRIQARPPLNHFPLVEDGTRSLLLAGGIGITPIWSMAQRLTALGRPWKLAYTCRAPEDALFLTDLRSIEHAHLHFSRAAGARMDMKALCDSEPENTHFYCCGPVSMLEAFEAATAGRPGSHIHLEAFAAREEAALGGGFTVELAKSGRSLFIPPGQSILDAIAATGLPVPHSCVVGVCGTCETTVLAGTPDHRDSILTATERESGKTMMICCSGSLTEKLVLDL
jgi:tetrachlorobenzoquinone reductase